jgi:hypothetical protein
MPGLDQLIDIIKQLNGTAQPRPDLGGGSPYTFAGRVATGPEDPRALLARQPVEAPDGEGMGAVGKAVATASFAPIVTKAQKKIVKAAYRASPDVVKEANELPQMLKVGVDRLELDPYSVPSGFYRGNTGQMAIDPSVMAGQVPQSKLAKAYADAIAHMRGIPAKSLYKTGKTSDLGNLPLVAAHEMQHHINKNRILPTLTAGPEGPASITNRISPALRAESGREQVNTLFRQGDKIAAVDEALAYLREAAIRNPNDPSVQALAAEFLTKGK